jgi:hypothetical protein
MKLIIQLQKTDESIISQIKQEAKQQNIDFNAFLIDLIRTGLQTLQNQQPIYHDLDNLAGTWSKEDEETFTQATTDFNRIDEALWA